jgi:hypothetical protein
MIFFEMELNSGIGVILLSTGILESILKFLEISKKIHLLGIKSNRNQDQHALDADTIRIQQNDADSTQSGSTTLSITTTGLNQKLSLYTGLPCLA